MVWIYAPTTNITNVSNEFFDILNVFDNNQEKKASKR